jgi:MoxR-like ATPase
MLFATTGASEEEAQTVMSAKELLAAQHLVRMIPVGESVSDAVLKLVRSARPQETDDKFIKDNVAWGPSPRASQALMLGAKARALLDGRLSPSVDDVLHLATPVMRHRMAITFAARQDGVSLDDVIARLTEPLR